MGVLVDGIEQAGHSRMGECRVADNGHRWMLSGVGSAFGHCYRRSHVDNRVDSVERSEPAEGVAADVTEHFRVGIFGKCGIQGGIDVAVAATLTEGGRARNGHFARSGNVEFVDKSRAEVSGQARQSLSHSVGVELAGARQIAVEFSVDFQSAVEYAAKLFFDNRLPLFDDYDGVDRVGQALEHLARNRILADLQRRERILAFGKHFVEIVEGQTADNDSETGVGAVDITVEGRFEACGLHSLLFGDESFIAHARVSGHQHPLARFFGIMDDVRLARSLDGGDFAA